MEWTQILQISCLCQAKWLTLCQMQCSEGSRRTTLSIKCSCSPAHCCASTTSSNSRLVQGSKASQGKQVSNETRQTLHEATVWSAMRQTCPSRNEDVIQVCSNCAAIDSCPTEWQAAYPEECCATDLLASCTHIKQIV